MLNLLSRRKFNFGYFGYFSSFRVFIKHKPTVKRGLIFQENKSEQEINSVVCICKW